MATNPTTNYQLNQWEPTDQVLRTDFNADNAKLDAALADLANSKADQSGLDALSATVAGHTAAIAQCGNCKIVYGTYVGTGTYGQDFPSTLTFDYKSLLVSIMPADTSSMSVAIGFHAVRGSNFLYTLADSFNSDVTLNWQDKALSWWGSSSSYQYNMQNQAYCYVALLSMG